MIKWSVHFQCKYMHSDVQWQLLMNVEDCVQQGSSQVSSAIQERQLRNQDAFHSSWCGAYRNTAAKSTVNGCIILNYLAAMQIN